MRSVVDASLLVEIPRNDPQNPGALICLSHSESLLRPTDDSRHAQWSILRTKSPEIGAAIGRLTVLNDMQYLTVLTSLVNCVLVTLTCMTIDEVPYLSQSEEFDATFRHPGLEIDFATRSQSIFKEKRGNSATSRD